MIIRIFTTIPLFLVIVLGFLGCDQKSPDRADLSSELGVESTTRSGNRAATTREYKAPLNGVGPYFSPKCRGFIASDGSLGPWGKEFVEAMHDVERVYGGDIFFGKGSKMVKFGSRCKSSEYFESLTQSQQEHIWAWTWASIAQAESSCDPEEDARGIWNARYGRYNKADGLVQLEYYTKTRNGNNRDRRFCPDRTNSKAIRFQARCGASIMARAHSGRFLYTQGQSYTYWLKLKKNKGTIFKLLKRHPLCK